MASSSTRSRPSAPRLAGARPLGVARTTLMAGGLSLATFAFYFIVYPIRNAPLPLGFDPSYYIWRAQFLASSGLGSGLTASRPGYPVLSVLLGAVTGRSQLGLTAVLSIVLVSMLALAVGALCRRGLGFDRRGWAVAVAVAGLAVGPTHLVGENLATILFLTLAVAALSPLGDAASGGRGLWAAVLLAIAAGLAHWDFTAVFGLVILVAFVAALPGSLREARSGTPALGTESGVLGRFCLWVGAILAGAIFGVTRAPLRTTDLPTDPLLYLRKFRTDLAPLASPTLAGLGAGPLLRRLDLGGGSRPGSAIDGRRTRFSIRALEAWAVVMVTGIAFGVLTEALPPARFLALLVALPGAAGFAAILIWLARRVPPGASARRGAVMAVGLALLAVPAGLRWYAYPMLMAPDQLRDARTAASYVRGLPPGERFVFLVSYIGRPGVYESVLKERTIRIALPADREADARFFVGLPADLLAARRTQPPDARAERVTRGYWMDLAPVLASGPPIIILRSMAPAEFDLALGLGGVLIGPGVELLRGTPPAAALPGAALQRVVPDMAASLAWAGVILLVLGIVGWGWTLALLERDAPVEALVSLSPVVGAAVLILAGTLVGALGFGLGGGIGIAAVLAAAVGGATASRASRD